MKNIFVSPARESGNSFNRIITFSLFLSLSLITFLGFAQTPNTWTQKADLGGSAGLGVGFSIGTKGYTGTGYKDGIATKDFWEYDQVSDAWTQKADFGGVARVIAVGFSIGSKGYIGTGDATGGNAQADFWEWDQTTNTWLQKANFGNPGIVWAVGFSIGNKGYIGTGHNYNNSSDSKEFWEWDQATDTWTKKADFGGTARQRAIGFSIGNKGYIGTGISSNGPEKDFWEWDQATNIWIQKADFGGNERHTASGFSIAQKGYIGTGVDASWTTFYKDFWEWDQATDVWIQKADFGGSARVYAVGFSIGTKGYIGTGHDNAPKQDFWEYTPGAEACPGTFVTNAGPDTTVYYGYLPEQCTTLNGSATGGTSPFQYLWSTGETTASISVCPTDSTDYTLTATDANGCSNSDQVSVKVIDVRCNDKGKVTICHNPGPNQVTICISPNAVENQLANGDMLGTCGIARMLNLDASETEKPITFYPNPGSGLISVEVCKNNVVKEAKIEIKNSIGQIVFSKITQGSSTETIELNNDLPAGMYFLNLIIGEKLETRKFILTK